jgi:hypothetical protein
MGKGGNTGARHRQRESNRLFESESRWDDHTNPKRCGTPNSVEENLEYSRQNEMDRKRESEIERLRNEQRRLKEREEKYKEELNKLKEKRKELREVVKQHRRDEQMEAGIRRERETTEDEARLRHEEMMLRREDEANLRREEEARLSREKEDATPRREEEMRLRREEAARLKRGEDRLRREELARQQEPMRREQEGKEEQRRRHEEWARQEQKRREDEQEASRRVAREREEQRQREELLIAEIERQNEWEKVSRRPRGGLSGDQDEPQKRSELFILDIPKDYAPDELDIKTEGHKLQIKGTQFCKCEDGCVYKEFERSLNLPPTVATDNLSATLDSYGRLRINGYRYSHGVSPSDRSVSVRGLGIPHSSGRTKCTKRQRGVNIRTTRNNADKPQAYEYDEVTGTYDPIDDDGITVENEPEFDI